jgi:steroid 5-alpha reductase family enzyme
MSPFLFQIFNITFIATYQNILLFLIVVPVHVCWLSRNSTPTLTTYDFVSISLFLAFWIGETVADQQQWNFQSKKYQLIREKKELKGYVPSFLVFV